MIRKKLLFCVLCVPCLIVYELWDYHLEMMIAIVIDSNYLLMYNVYLD